MVPRVQQLLADAISGDARQSGWNLDLNRKLDPHQMGFAFGEALAHVNHMLALGELRGETDSTGILRLSLA